jgi:hypothetical protein
MKILFFSLSLLLFSSAAIAQLKTGGMIPTPRLPSLVMQVQDKVSHLEMHLRIKDKFCSGKNLADKSDFLQTYFKLSMVRSMSNTNADCSEVNAYFQCLNDENTVILVKQIKKDPGYHEWMKVKYKLDSKQANQILDFYSELGKKVK